MNLKNKIFTTLALVLTLTCQAELIHIGPRWALKEGTTSVVAAPTTLPELLNQINEAQTATDAKDYSSALSLWNKIAETQFGHEGEAIALIARAKIHIARNQFEPAEREDLDEFFKRHTNYVNFQDAVDLDFIIASRLADGVRPKLAGWFPWFKDRLHAVSVYEKVVRVAPNGQLADIALIRIARLNADEGRTAESLEALERIVSDYSSSKYAPEALEKLAKLRSEESLGPDWDQASTIDSADHWKTLADQYPNDPRAKNAPGQIKLLRDRAARARLNLGKFYWFSRNNPEAAKLMANACRSISPESEAAAEAQNLLKEIEKNPNPPETIADKLLGNYPRPSSSTDNKPVTVGDELDALGFRRETINPATENSRP
jgi:outer membrane protein assembly factor BamD (BamD/ComL family)